MARYSNYSFSTGAQFDPMTFQEILTPYVMYKEEFDKAETAYNELSTNADKYKYLGEQLEGTDSKAAKIYKGYADELNKQANDFAKHGLNILNRRGLTNLKRRYSGEIGRLDLANTAMEKERELRRTLNAKDSSMLYAQDNLNIDDFLDNATPNLYNISGTELYTRGAAAGKSAASRVYSAGDAGSTLNGYYRDWVERNGYSKESMDAFRANVSAIPELQQAADAILQERGVLDNLTGNNLARARQAVLNGIIDGAVYTEKHNPVRDLGRMSAQEADASARGWAAYNLQKEEHDLKVQEYNDERQLKYTFDEDGNVTGINPEYLKLTGRRTTTPKQEPSPGGAESTDDNSSMWKYLQELKHSDLAHNEGFDVNTKDNRYHYEYIGGIDNTGKKHGKIGDTHSHTWLGTIFDHNSTENWRGNYSAESNDNKNNRILSPSEKIYALQRPEVMKSVREMVLDKVQQLNGKKDTKLDDISEDYINTMANAGLLELVKVPDEAWGHKSGYLVAMPQVGM